jgi:integrase
MPRRLPRYCVEDVDRHGNIRIYFRRHGRKTRLSGTPWTDEFMAAYDEAKAGSFASPAAPRPERRKVLPGTWRALCQDYLGRSGEYRTLEPSTREAYRRTLESTYDESIKPGSPVLFADIPIARMQARQVRVLRDRKIEQRAAANNRVKVIRSVFRFAVEDEQVKENPAAAVSYFKTSTKGHHTWTVEEVRKFEERHPIGTTARLAMALMLYTGCRRSDAVLLGRQHARDGWLKWTAYKNRNRSPIEIEIPILPTLQAVLKGTKTGQLTYLITKFGKPYSMAGFSGQFRDWCDQAELPHCSAHGLRKAGATIAAENGATEHQLMAIFGWVDPKMAARYTQGARRRKLAEGATRLFGFKTD